MIVYHQDNVAAFAGAHTHYWQFQPILQSRISATTAAAAGRIMSSLAKYGGLASKGGIAGQGGGLAA